ncbi:acyltransferase family protein [Piscinibacter gummiphilus]|uniref:Acyltransferase family protein n=1 Tax=Piscinibacter gummiphilus TaxID=946333 RepID=A0ABZ0CXR7_9BURK|nr:acyltransferase family protein [Piscinibacter gummiphilus]WOB07274.1 acyltransferase family protein [Piscinibacter gummiphilus]
MSPARDDYRLDLNGLRGLAVALVVAFHLQIKGATGGFIGVDVFFVLSGYLMTQMVWRRLDAGRFSYADYLARRAARIWPALAALVLLLLVAGAAWLPPFDMQRLAEQGVRALAFVSNHYFFAHSGYITHAGDSLWLLHTWSLSVEWQFYLLYPLLLIVITRWAPPARRKTLAVAGVALLLLASLVWHLWLSRRAAESGFFLLPARMWELLAGALVALLARPSAAGRWRPWVSHLGLALVLVGALLIAAARVRTVGAGAWLVLPVLGTAMVLWADADNRVLRHPVLQGLGLWSYSIYLWHWPLIIGLRLTDVPQAYPWASAAAIACASVLLGWASYTFVERPFKHRGAGWLRSVAAPMATMAVAGLVAFAVLATAGLPFRKPGRGESYDGYWASVNSRYFPDACSNYKKPLQEIKPCRIEKHTPARVLVIGDSHAEHFYAWFVAHSPGSVDFYTAAECPPVPNLRRTQPGYHCAEYAAEAWRKAQHEPYDSVVVAARWATIGLAGAPYCHLSASGSCTEPASLSAKQRVVLDELRAAVMATLAQGKTVVLVDSAPESTLRVADRVAREQFWYGQVRLSLPVATLRAQTGWMEPLFEGLGSTPGFHRVSLRGRLCNETSCRVYDEALKRPIYYDESHFDPLWIEQQADLFVPFMKPS